LAVEDKSNSNLDIKKDNIPLLQKYKSLGTVGMDGEQSQTTCVFFKTERPKISEFSQHGLLNRVAELLLILVAFKFYFLLFTLTTLPHSIITDSHSDDPNASGSV